MTPISSPSPVNVVCGIVQRQGRVLLAQRPQGKHLAGYWEFPGGKIEAGEAPETALRRELDEELGCQVQGLIAGPVISWTYERGTIRLHAFLCELATNSAEPQAFEHQALQWQLPKEINPAMLAPADGPILDWLLTR